MWKIKYKQNIEKISFWGDKICSTCEEVCVVLKLILLSVMLNDNVLSVVGWSFHIELLLILHNGEHLSNGCI